jgi:hypothetical protein
MAPLAGLVLLIDLWRHRNIRRFLGDTPLLWGALFIILAGWWFWRNWSLYQDPTALAAHLLYRGGALDPTPTLRSIWQTELVGLELSYWAAFGAGQILLEPGIYAGLKWLRYLVFVGVLIGFVGLLRPLVASRQPSVLPEKHLVRLWSVTILLLWAIINFLALMRWMQIMPASWGRLLYPSLPAVAVLAAWGLSQFALLGTRVPGQKKVNAGWLFIGGFKQLAYLLPWIIAGVLFLLSVTAPFMVINPAYAETQLISETDLPPDTRPLDLYLGDERLRLVGYKIPQTNVKPGEWLPVTLYWQATQPIAKNYSTFVHLLTPAGDAVAQANTYPDRGRWPTSMLPPGEILPATYYVYVPPEIPTPLAARFAFGIFEFEDPQRLAKPAVDNIGRQVEPIVDGIPVLPDQWPKLSPAHSLSADFDRQISLIGIDPINNSVSPGTAVPITLYWRTEIPPGQELNLFIHLVDPDTGEQIAGFDGPPAFPTRYWTAGSTFIDTRTLNLPADMPAGEYILKVGCITFRISPACP